MEIQVLKYLSGLLLFVQGYFCYSSSASASAAASASSQSNSPNFPLYPPHSQNDWIPSHISQLPPPLPPLIIDNTKKDNNIINLLFLLMALKNKKPNDPCCCCPHHHIKHPHHPPGAPADCDDSYDPYEHSAEITVTGGYIDEPVSGRNEKIITSPGCEPNEIHLVIRTDFAHPC